MDAVKLDRYKTANKAVQPTQPPEGVPHDHPNGSCAMNTLTPIGRALAAVSTLGMCLLIATAVTRFSATTMHE